MATFTDNTGRQWSMRIDVGAALRARDRVGVDLLTIHEPGKIDALLLDMVRFADVAYAILRPDVRAAGITEADFGAALMGDAFNDAADAFITALLEFFPEITPEDVRKSEQAKDEPAKAEKPARPGDPWRMVWEIAGVIGLDPRPYTLRELAWMNEGCRRQAWDHTASMLALTVNINRDPKKGKAAKPADFHPFMEKKKEEPIILTMEELRIAFEGITK